MYVCVCVCGGGGCKLLTPPLLSKSESVKFLLIESVICIFTDSLVKNIFHC